MKATLARLFLGAVLTAVAAPVVAQEARCPREGSNAPAALHKQWIMEGWERREGDPPFDFARKLGKFYDLKDSKGVFWDNFAPGDSQLFHDAVRYGENWKQLQDAARSVLHGLTDQGDALVGDQVASTTLGFVGRLERLSGEIIAFRARSQLGWQCSGGTWKIRHEMNYAWEVEPKTIEPLLGRR